MSEIHENLLTITKYELLGKLPDPFVFDDGHRVETEKDWAERRKEIYKSAVELQYGTISPSPESVEVEPLYLGAVGKPSGYKVTVHANGKSLSFKMVLFRARSLKAPAVISGDLCFQYAYDKEYIETFTNSDINLVLFDRTEIAPDIAPYNLKNLGTEETFEYARGKEIFDGLDKGCCGGPLKEMFPDYTFGAVGAWAWGYSVCVDALTVLGNVDTDFIVFTGHSRGGKAAALAGAIDERAKIVNHNASCAGGYGSYRIKIEAVAENGKKSISEPISNIFKVFPSWMGQELRPYIDREAELPFDAHYLKALVAPRILSSPRRRAISGQTRSARIRPPRRQQRYISSSVVRKTSSGISDAESIIRKLRI